ncbi:MAG: polysaccharide pyruvyl transferase CsaB [Bacteroidota bacterium]
MAIIVISGYYGAGNIGDEAILAAMLQALARTLPGSETVVLSRDPAATTAAHGVPALHRGPWRDLRAKMRLFRRADLLLSGGGGLLQDSYPKRFLPLSVLYYLSVCILAKLCGCKVMFYAQGVGPLRGRLARRLVRAAGNRADLIAVRDGDSAALLRRLGVDRPPIHVTADPVLAWRPGSEGDIVSRYGLGQGRPYIALAVRPWPGDEAYLATVARLADRAAAEWQWRPVFVPFARETDLKAIARARAFMRESASAVVLPDLTPAAAFAVIARARMVLGARLHAVIFAALAGTVPIGLAYDPKVSAFLAALGFPELSCPLSTDGETIWRMLASADKRRDAIIEAMAARTAALGEQALGNARLAGELLP